MTTRRWPCLVPLLAAFGCGAPCEDGFGKVSDGHCHPLDEGGGPDELNPTDCAIWPL